VQSFGLFDALKRRTEIDYLTYEKLHRGQPVKSILGPKGSFALTNAGAESGVRMYKWFDGERESPAPHQTLLNVEKR
jgi:hypothetical protein